MILIGLLGILIPGSAWTAASPSARSASAASATLTVFAASSLADAFKEIATEFRAANPDVEVVFNFGASSTLAAQLKQGAPADLFASANTRQMDVACESGRIAGTPQVFARNRLILIVPAARSATAPRIASLGDLAQPGIKLVVAAPNVPVRDYTNIMLDKLATVPDYGSDYKAGFLKNIVSEEDNVRQVVLKVALGEADAGIVYQSDVTPDVAPKVVTLPIADEYNTIATYPIAVTNDSAYPQLAQAFINALLSPSGQSILVKWGFVPMRDRNEIATLPATLPATPAALPSIPDACPTSAR